MASSVDSTDSYNGDDAWHFLHEWDKALGRHWEATQETKRLEAALAASQAALAVVEGRSNTARVRLAESDARVIGRILRSNSVPSSSCLVTLLLMISSFVITTLIEELEALQLAVNKATRALNA